jgi:hypothetical protein
MSVYDETVPFINLILAGFWIVIGLVLLAPGWLSPGQPVLLLPGTRLPIGWLAMFLGCYNIVRWWMQRSQSRRQREMQDALAKLHRRRTRPESPVEPDPNFIFTDEPPERSAGN